MIKTRTALKPMPCFTCKRTIQAKEVYHRQTATYPPRCYCHSCFTSGSSDYLMWVGSSFYPTIQDFVQEASQQGVCKRVPKIPSDIKPGVSRVFLIHDEGEVPSPQEKARGILSYGRIFGFFPLMHVRLILDDPETIAKYQDQLKELPLEVLGVAEAIQMPVRGCGHLVEGAVYLVSPVDMDKVWQIAQPLADKVDIKGGLVLLRQPVAAHHLARFRGIKYLDSGLIPPLDTLGISLGRHQLTSLSREVALSPK